MAGSDGEYHARRQGDSNNLILILCRVVINRVLVCSPGEREREQKSGPNWQQPENVDDIPKDMQQAQAHFCVEEHSPRRMVLMRTSDAVEALFSLRGIITEVDFPHEDYLATRLQVSTKQNVTTLRN